jgi:hypothetical protein
MERNVLNTLKFDLSAATIRNFTKRFLKAAEANQKTRFLAYVRPALHDSDLIK